MDPLDTNTLHVLEKPKEATLFFNRRISQGSSFKSSKVTCDSTEGGYSGLASIRNGGSFTIKYKNIKKENNLQTRMQQDDSSPEFLQIINKQIGNEHRQVKYSHLIFKESGVEQKTNIIQLSDFCQNPRSISDPRVKPIIKVINVREPQSGKLRKSTFAKSIEMKHKTRTLEQAIIDDVLLYEEKSNYRELKTSDLELDELLKEAEKKQKESVKRNFLEGHEINEDHRNRLIDWMIQVLRVLKVSSPSTFFMAVDILNRYCFAMQQMKNPINKDDLYLIGLTAIFMSSKVQDVTPIRMMQILDDAGHFRFSRIEIVMMEQNILEALNFKMNYQSPFEEATLLFKDLIYTHKKRNLCDSDFQDALEFLLLLCQLVVFNIDISLKPQKILTLVILKETLGFLSRRYKYYQTLEQTELIQDQITKSLKFLSFIKSEIKEKYMDSLIIDEQSNYIDCRRAVKQFVRNEDMIKLRRNLIKNFPQFLGENSFPYAFVNPLVMKQGVEQEI